MRSDAKTKEILDNMLKQDTGRALCDSGGTPSYDANGNYAGSEHGYGRAFERNRGRNFENESESVVDFRHGEVNVTHNVYHWLASRLTYNETRDQEFQKWCELPENEDEHWLSLMEGYMEHLKTLADRPPCDECMGDSKGQCECGGERDGCGCDCHEKRHEPHGIYGDGEPVTVNTYNGEDLLSQTLQFIFWTEGEGRGSREAFVLLQTHNGADVRGGYSRPRLFEVTGDSDETCIFDNARGAIGCSECEAVWTTDDGCNWYPDGVCGAGYTHLEDEEKIEASDGVYAIAKAAYDRLIDEERRQLKLFRLTPEAAKARLLNRALALPGEEEGEAAVRTIVVSMVEEKPLLRYTEDGKGYCPRCKEGELSASFY